MRFDKGYLNPYFVTDPDRQEVVFEEPTSCIGKSEDLEHQGSSACARQGDPESGKHLVIISEDIEGEALATLVVNKIRGIFKSVCRKGTWLRRARKAQLQDIAILTGGQVITEEVGLKLENTELELLGRARKVIVTDDDDRRGCRRGRPDRRPRDPDPP